MDTGALKRQWLIEESAAFQGWDFSHLDGRWRVEDTPWDYGSVVRAHLRPADMLLDMGTGGGEFLLTLGHPPHQTCVTEGWPPNHALCQARLAPLGIRVEQVLPDDQLRFGDALFDVIINRHESFDMAEVRRVLKPGGLFITQQVGGVNELELGRALVSDFVHPFAHHTLAHNAALTEAAGFAVLDQREAFPHCIFDDVGAVVYYAKTIPWIFPDFSVERYLPGLLRLQEQLETNGQIDATGHRFLLVARKTP